MTPLFDADTPTSASLCQPSGIPRPTARPRLALLLGPLLALFAWLPLPAHALDGCLVLMCLAAPSWSSIPQCVAPIRQVLSDLAQGHPFPTCSMAGAGNAGTVRAADPPAYCPPQYSHADYLESGIRYTCDYDGAVEVQVNGSLWARTWWNLAGGSVTEFTPSAKAQLGTWDTRFDDDYIAWQGTWTAPVPDSIPVGG